MMKNLFLILLALVMTMALLACAAEPLTVTSTPLPPETTIPVTTVPETTVPETTVPETTVPPHTELYLEDCSLDMLLTYWDEVVLNMEYSDESGNPSLVQKWLSPICCRIYGKPTDEDMAVLELFFTELNQIPGFPGIHFAAEDELENMTLNFLGPEDFQEQFGETLEWESAWGATQFWYYTDTNDLYDGRIGYRTDIDQTFRSSILLEEIVNTLGIADTELREDSIVYQYSNDNLNLSDVDWLILKLLYHPSIRPGMDMEESHRVLAELYN